MGSWQRYSDRGSVDPKPLDKAYSLSLTPERLSILRELAERQNDVTLQFDDLSVHKIQGIEDKER